MIYLNDADNKITIVIPGEGRENYLLELQDTLTRITYLSHSRGFDNEAALRILGYLTEGVNNAIRQAISAPKTKNKAIIIVLNLMVEDYPSILPGLLSILRNARESAIEYQMQVEELPNLLEFIEHLVLDETIFLKLWQLVRDSKHEKDFILPATSNKAA